MSLYIQKDFYVCSITLTFSNTNMALNPSFYFQTLFDGTDAVVLTVSTSMAMNIHRAPHPSLQGVSTEAPHPSLERVSCPCSAPRVFYTAEKLNQ